MQSIRSVRSMVGIAFATLAVLLSLTDLAFAQLPPFTYYQGVPKQAVNAASGPIVLPFAILNTTTGKSVMLTATVNSLAAWPAMAGETTQQASLRKAQAVVAAINASINAAITAGTLPANTPLASATPGPANITVVARNGRQFVVPNPNAGAGLVSIPNATGIGGKGSADPSGEPAQGGFGVQGNGGGGGTGGSMGGKGATQGYSTGDSTDSSPAEVWFGIVTPQAEADINDDGTTCDTGINFSTDPTPLESEAVDGCPGADIVSVQTSAGETDETIMENLESEFNMDFGSQGFTATYDPTADVLSIDQVIPQGDEFYFDDTDTGLLGDLYAQELEVPEPASLLLFGTGLAAIVATRRRHQKRAAA
ncbi:MAG TPA: PEP-CTERM sorting domain-containing protein [Stellaceae bacterium]|nr:PEP-CTERM sorting domain-containing protein [Stellaceae bacterium]